MCVVCVLWEKGKLKPKEAEDAIVELLRDGNSEVDLNHAELLIEKIEKESENEKDTASYHPIRDY